MSLVRLRPEAPRCRNSGAVCGRSSSGRARPCQGRGSEFEPRRPLQKEYPIRQDGVFFLECAAAPENSLPRPARSASNQEVRQGSCEWRQPFVGCREASSSLVARSKNTTLPGGVFFVRASTLAVVSAGCRRLRFSAYCAIFRVVMTRKWGRRTRFRQNNRYFAFFLAMEKSMCYTGAEYNSECAGGLHRCGLGAPLLRAVAGNVCTHDRDPVHRRRRDIAAPHGGLTEPGRRP